MKYMKPMSGDTRIIKRFAFLPICIGQECRYLEIVQIKQCFSTERYFKGVWEDIEFV